MTINYLFVDRDDGDMFLFAMFAACQCNMHSTECGMAGCVNCQHFTTGTQCQNCIAGYYGDATRGTPTDCQQCQCNTWATTCVVNVADPQGHQCTSCTGFTAGNHCERCQQNFFGTPVGGVRACQSCQPGCNNNLNLAVPNSCDSSTGACLICSNNAAGSRCEVCATGFFGDATQQNCNRMSSQCRYVCVCVCVCAYECTCTCVRV